MNVSLNKSMAYGAVKAPSSKSYAQRAIAAALLAPGNTVLQNMELCSDTQAALEVARNLGATYRNFGDTYNICGSLSPVTDIIDIGESGLSIRMFTPIASLCEGPVTITGHGSILKRPVDMMIEPLRRLGVSVESAGGYLPVTVRGPMRGGETVVDGSVSSQFITGLLMALPLAAEDSTVHVTRPTSIPYLDMTVDVLRSFGIEIKQNGYTEFFIEGGQQYRPGEYNIEGDWSGASCILVAGAVCGEAKVVNLNPLSKQADVAIIDALFKAGASIVTTPESVTVTKKELNAFEFDATNSPDLFPALAVLAANCRGVSVIKGMRRLRHKESDRAMAIKGEFLRFGIEVDIDRDDIMTIQGGTITSATADSRNDHRIAMAEAVLALCADGGRSTITDAGCVAKSYPAFWSDLASIAPGSNLKIEE